MSTDEDLPTPTEGDGTVTVRYPFALHLCVGQVAVIGARVEGALVRLHRHLEPTLLSQPYTEVMRQPTCTGSGG